MKTILGRVLFWLSWPLLYFYTPLFVRSRILVVCGSEFLAVKAYFGSGAWQLPGGGRHGHETAQQAAVRELYEETTVEVSSTDVISLLEVGTFHETGLRFRYALCAVKIPTKKDVVMQKNEIAACAWLPIQNQAGKWPAHIAKALQSYAEIKEYREGLLK